MFDSGKTELTVPMGISWRHTAKSEEFQKIKFQILLLLSVLRKQREGGENED